MNTKLQQNYKPGKPGKKMPGVCLTMDEVTYICVGNTTAGIKLATAVQTCNMNDHLNIYLPVPQESTVPFGIRKGKGGKGNGKGKGKGKGKGSKPPKSCPTADEILEMFYTKFAGLWLKV